MPDKLQTELLQSRFGPDDDITAQDLRQLYADAGEPELNENTLLSRIHHLKKKGVLSSRSRGVFVLGGRPDLSAFYDYTNLSLLERIQTSFPHIRTVAWSTKALDTIAEVESGQIMSVIETDKEACESVFDELKTTVPGLFLSPDKVILERYVPVFEHPVIIKPLISEAPVTRIRKIPVPALEKTCVDLLADTALFTHWQGTILRDFFRNVFARNIINRSSLNRYASRRGRQVELKRMMRNLNLQELT